MSITKKRSVTIETENLGDTQLQAPISAAEKKRITAAEKKRKWDREYSADRRAKAKRKNQAEEADEVEDFQRPFDFDRNVIDKIESRFDFLDVGKVSWKSSASAGIRRLQVLNDIAYNFDSCYGEVPHFGSSDDKEILNSFLTMHEGTKLK